MVAEITSVRTFPHAGLDEGDAAARRLTAGLLVASEVISFGLRAMLEACDLIKDVRPCGPAAAFGEDGVDVLIVCGRQFAGGPEEARLEAAAASGVKIIVILEDDGGTWSDRVFRIPCHGFILQRELSVDVLSTTISRIYRGEIPMPGAVARNLIAAVNGADRRPRSCLSSLTPREMQTLDLLVKGLSNKQIARQLLISQHGAKRLVANILAKLNCENRTLAVAMALREDPGHDYPGRASQSQASTAKLAIFTG